MVEANDYKLLEQSNLFDAKWYLEKYPDVKKANMDPIVHYLECGWKEGRKPSAQFNGNFYLRFNDDVKHAQMCPLVHWETHGKFEGRKGAPTKMITEEIKCDNYVNIVLTGDEKYVMPMGVTMFSIVKNLSKGRVARFFLFVSGWGDNEEDEIRELQNYVNCEIEIIHMESKVTCFEGIDIKKFHNTYIQSLATYYRLLMPRLLPDFVNKAFYVDSDIIVDADLCEVYDKMTADKLLAAVPDFPVQMFQRDLIPQQITWNEFEPFRNDPQSAPYVCAGFFLMNVELARNLSIVDDFMQFLQDHPNPPLADQDTLNAVCSQKYAGRMIYLPLKWNVFCDVNYDAMSSVSYGCGHSAIREAGHYPKIYHYGGKNKPWINKLVSKYYHVYEDYWKLSPFYRTPQETLKLTNQGASQGLLQVEPQAHISRISFLGLPILKIRKLKAGGVDQVFKGYLFGMSIFKKYPTSLTVLLLGIPIFKCSWASNTRNSFSCKLFSLLPIISTRDRGYLWYYWKYRILSKITTGALREKFKAKKLFARQQLDFGSNCPKSQRDVKRVQRNRKYNKIINKLMRCFFWARKKNPLISVIVASYNYEKLIGGALDSILNQTYKNYEIVVVDDGSRDNSVEVIKRYVKKYDNVFLYMHEGGVNKGLSETVQLGLEKARGDYVAFCESDDSWTPDYLEEKIRIINRYPNVAIISNNIELIGEKSDEFVARERYINGVHDLLIPGCNFLATWDNDMMNIVPTFSCVMIKRKIFKGLNFDSPIPAWLDWWLYKQILQHHKLYYCPKKVTIWNAHGDSFNNANSSNNNDYKKTNDVFQAKYREIFG